jgi:MFS family permease
MSSSVSDTAPATSPIKVASASFIGTTVEYYDFFIYGTAAALVFPKLFFPNTSPLVGALLSFATLGVGFLARPVGGVVFGHFGDRVGRKKMLIISLVTMGLATTLMGLMPSYAVIGMAAPILLTLLRLVQGFAVGGEWGGATLMAVEHAPPGRRGFFGAFPQMGAPAGVGLATIAFFLASQLAPAQFESWGWRLPFLFSAVLVLVGLFIRLSIAESPEFEKVREAAVEVKMPIAEAFRRHPREIFLVAGTYLSQGVLAYICMSYLVSFATTQVGIPRPNVLMGVFVAAVVATVLYPVFGSLSDRWGRKTTYLLGRGADVGEHHPGVPAHRHRQRAGLRLRPGAGVRHRHGARRRGDRLAVQPDLQPGGPLQRRLGRLHHLAGLRRRVRPVDRHRPVRDQRLHRAGGDLPAGRVRDLGDLRAVAARQAR